MSDEQNVSKVFVYFFPVYGQVGFFPYTIEVPTDVRENNNALVSVRPI